MHRATLILLSVVCALGPRVALAEDDVLTRFQEWLSKIGKPAPPPEDLGPWNTFTLNPIAFKERRLGIEYERALGRGFSLYLEPEFTYGRAERSWHLALGGTLGARIFVLGKAPSGIYFGPEVAVDYQRNWRNQVLRKAFGLGVGGSVGCTLVFFNRITLAAGFSAQYRAIPDLESSEEGSIRVEIIPMPRLAFGVAF